MKHDLLAPPDRSDPAIAFEALRGEVSLLRRALEGLTAERKAAPDYTPTLAEQALRLGGIEEALEGLSQRPALQLTPESLAASIARAGERVRADDRATLQRATSDIGASIEKFDGAVRRARTVEQQRYFLAGMMLAALWVGIHGGLALGRLIGPGVVALTTQVPQKQSTPKAAKIDPNPSKSTDARRGKSRSQPRERSSARPASS